MRLWHYGLLPHLDDFHIVSQWRELLAIKGAIDKNGTPNHRLVNKVLDYTLRDFKAYCLLVVGEMDKRGISYQKSKLAEIYHWKCDLFNGEQSYFSSMFEGWHSDRYLTQCYYNLQEKADCGIVSEKAWLEINKFYKENSNEY